MKQSIKRMTALILAMAMCLSLLSANVWATEESPEDGSVSAQSSGEAAPDEGVPAEEEAATEEEMSAGESVAAETEMEGDSAPNAEEPPDEENLTVEEPDIQQDDDEDDTDYDYDDDDDNPYENDDETTGKCGAALTWSVENSTLTISGTGAMDDYDYKGPWGNSYSGYGYTIKTVVIEDGVTSIGTNAFRGLEQLSSVTIGNGVTTIGKRAFYECEQLASVTIGDSVATIGDDAFGYCKNLTTVEARDFSVLPYDAFSDTLWWHTYQMEHAEPLQLDNTVTLTKEKCGKYYYFIAPLPDLYQFVVSGTNRAWMLLYDENGKRPHGSSSVLDSAMAQGDKVFVSVSDISEAADLCVRKSEVETSGQENQIRWSVDPFTETLTISGSGPMDDWKNNTVPWREVKAIVSDVVISDGITSIGSRAFSGCTNLAHITIPTSVSTIGEYAFYDCESLTSVIIPDGVTTIGSSAFSYCNSLTSANIPDGVTTIADETFNCCRNLTSITIPSGVTTIGMEAFYRCGISEITIPDTVTKIGDDAFAYSSLSTVNINDQLEYRDNAFSLTPWYVNRQAQELELNQQVSCSIEGQREKWFRFTAAESGAYTLSRANTVGGWLETRWYDSNLNKLNESAGYEIAEQGKTYYLCVLVEERWDDSSEIVWDQTLKFGNEEEPEPTSGSGTFGENNLSWELKDGTLTISGTGAMEDDELPWATMRGSIHTIVVSDGITSICSGAFYHCHCATKATISDSVTQIGYEAFRECESLQSIQLPASLTTIGNYAFEDCAALKSITIPDSVTQIGSDAFWGCESLQSIQLSASLTTIDNSAFEDCAALKSITIPDRVETLGEYAFRDCTSLEDVTLPDGFDYPENAFEGTPWQYKMITGNMIAIKDGDTISATATRNHPNVYLSFTAPEDGWYQLVAASNKGFGSPYIELFTEHGTNPVDFSKQEERYTELSRIKLKKGEQRFFRIRYWVDDDDENDFNCTMTLTKYNEPASGTCGKKLKWKIEDGVLIISGTGSMTNYNWDDAPPWKMYKKEITAVRVEEGVNTIGTQACMDLYQVTSVTLPDGLISIGQYGFEGTSLKSISIPASVKSIHRDSFHGFGSDYWYEEPIDFTVYAVVGSAGHIFARDRGSYGYKFVAVDPNHSNHTYGEPLWSWSDDYSSATATFTCVNNDDTQSVNATITDDSTPGTCMDPAKTVYTATVTFQNQKYTDQKTVEGETDSTNHTGGTEVRGKKEATCTEEGYTGDTYCKGCNQVIQAGTVVDALGHDWGEWKTTKEPTETETGEEQRICNRDPSHIEKREINIINHVHTMKKVEATAETCTEAGNIEYWTCLGCHKYYREEEAINEITEEETVVKARGHDWGEPTYEWSADNSKCTAKRVCKRDASHVEEETVNTTSAVTKTATCKDKGETTYTATFKNTAFAKQTKAVETPVNPANHVGGTEIRNRKAATCGAAGYTGDTWCKGCNTKLSRGRTIPATGNHIWDGGVVTTQPTTAAAGVRTYTCTVCKQTKTESIPKLAPTLSATKSLKVKVKKTTATVTWKKNTKGKGYQIQYSTNKKFAKGVKTVNIKKNKIVKATVKKLSKGKTYYFRIRTVNGKKFSAWSGVKKVKVKK